MVRTVTLHYYRCVCDVCGDRRDVEEGPKVYNGAQAVRSLGWSYGKDRSVKCDECREREFYDRHKHKA